jgi:hypothetical protein
LRNVPFGSMLSKNTLPDLALVVELFSAWLGVEA